jgi:hypothetical protein
MCFVTKSDFIRFVYGFRLRFISFRLSIVMSLLYLSSHMEFWRYFLSAYVCYTVSLTLTRGRKHPFSETLCALVLLRIPDDGQNPKHMNCNSQHIFAYY